ncbi:MAG: hypothetical protein U5R31_17675 [Acidimicrobiia bacterium]|nr:hypothetical protein [Acidimicrobiia bacterium]
METTADQVPGRVAARIDEQQEPEEEVDPVDLLPRDLAVREQRR